MTEKTNETDAPWAPGLDDCAEYLNVWREDFSDFIPLELLEACTTSKHWWMRQ
jgi:hypothetical protein